MKVNRASFLFLIAALGFTGIGWGEEAKKVGATTCIACHSDQGEAFKKNPHSKNFPLIKNIPFEESCETCHGAGSLHANAAGNKADPGYATIKNPKKLSAGEASKTCLQCHEKGQQAFWKGSQHQSRSLSCLDCHSMHHSMADKLLKKESEMETCYQCHQLRKSQSMRSSHMPLREGKLVCTSCHNPHGSVGTRLLNQDTVNENCYSCHAEKRGPVLWEHPPVRENCLNCHSAHGSQHDKLLKIKRPRLCQQCHIESRHPSTGLTPDSIHVSGRACTECHSAIHGSNHPGGARFTR